MLPPVVMWIDPGKSTGLATYYSPQGNFYAQERDFTTAGRYIFASCLNYGPMLAIGWENYTVRPNEPQTNAHDALEMIGVARWCALDNKCILLGEPQPGDRKVATMAMLKALGWWREGQDDAQSAAQHLLAWMLRSNSVPPREAAVIAPYLGR